MQDPKIPANLKILVEIDGKPAEPITATHLSAIDPDYTDKDRRAWRIGSVVGAAFQRSNAVVEIGTSQGGTMLMRVPKSPNDLQPVLSLTRRGNLIAALVSPQDPFPSYHGRGGRLQRPGDPRPHVSAIEKLRIYVEKPSESQVWQENQQRGRAALASMILRVDGKAMSTNVKQFAQIAPLSIQGDTGERRAAWPLKKVVSLVEDSQPQAVIVADQDGGTLSISMTDWTNSKKTPVLRVNRQGLLKFQWLGADGRPTGERQVRGVRQVDVWMKALPADAGVQSN